MRVIWCPEVSPNDPTLMSTEPPNPPFAVARSEVRGDDFYLYWHTEPAQPAVPELSEDVYYGWHGGPPALGLGPRHDRTGTAYTAARIGQGLHAKLEAMTWTGCNGQRCGKDCGPGHSVRLWVPCQFAVGMGHSYHLDEKEIGFLGEVLASLEREA